MKRFFSLIMMFLLGVLTISSQHANVVWDSQSHNSSESMPCGGGDIGLNVWVENDDVLFYVSRSGTFDEHNCQLKQGRFRIRMHPNPFKDVANFKQELVLNDGYVSINAGDMQMQIWVDVFNPVVHVEVADNNSFHTEVYYENWRYQERAIRKGEGQQSSYKWAPPKGMVTNADSVSLTGDNGNRLLFYHRNTAQTVFDVAVTQQDMESVKALMMNPLKNLTFGGYFHGDGFKYEETLDGVYSSTDYRAWKFSSVKAMRKHHFCVVLHTEQTTTTDEWKRGLNNAIDRIIPQEKISSTIVKQDKKKTRLWWNSFWKRSFINATGGAQEISKNYTLFRYMLGCNAFGSVPTKFNGGLFTFDPCHVDEKQSFSPDYRKWGGGTMTAQNQRLVYWSMLKSGDFDMMLPQFDFYNRMLRNAELRSELYWQHQGACFAEQIENFGLPNPAEYGFKRPEWFDKGLEYNAWLEYEWDTVLEFCQMILETKRYANADISKYLPLIESTLTFFDQHYRQLASKRGRKELDGDGKLILFPGSACETYKMTNNASSTIAALRTVLESYGEKQEMLNTIPDIPLRYVEVTDSITNNTELIQTLSPAKSWERINNVETPQLYPVYPWRIYGVGKEGLDLARNTYLYDPDALKFRSHVGWKQDNIWAACLGLKQEAKRLALLKLSDGPHRFPAFWGPGYDWTPDHNWGGSGMIGLQEMLLQTAGDSILLFAAWSQEWDVHFKLHAPGNTTVEASLTDGKVTYLKVLPESRMKDVVLMIE